MFCFPIMIRVLSEWWPAYWDGWDKSVWTSIEGKNTWIEYFFMQRKWVGFPEGKKSSRFLLDVRCVTTRSVCMRISCRQSLCHACCSNSLPSERLCCRRSCPGMSRSALREALSQLSQGRLPNLSDTRGSRHSFGSDAENDATTVVVTTLNDSNIHRQQLPRIKNKP